MTDRKRAAAARRQHREQQGLPLLAPLIAEHQPDIDTIMQERVARSAAVEQA